MDHTGKISENHYFCIMYDTFYSIINGIKFNVQFFPLVLRAFVLLYTAMNVTRSYFLVTKYSVCVHLNI
jgi:hypothetical protein